MDSLCERKKYIFYDHFKQDGVASLLGDSHRLNYTTWQKSSPYAIPSFKLT